ncbi:MAG: ABC transporter ATP-binding protein [Parvibaculaceae bacterium]
MNAMAPAAGSPVLEVRNLSTWFDTGREVIKAVDDVSFTLKRGKTLCVVGESGSGKSITARSILNIVPKPGRIVQGSVLLHQATESGSGTIDLAKLDPRGRSIRAIRGREIAMIFQEPMSSLSPVHSIGQQIIEAIRLHRPMSHAQARARAIEVLEQVKIPRPERSIDSYPFEFSGGMRQRAMTAMALVCEPKLLIADEPTTALDVTTQAEILELMQGLQSLYGMALMFITHDMGVVAEIADDVAVMHDGKLVEQGPVKDIFLTPQHPYTQRLLGSVLALERRSRRAAERPATETQDNILEVSGLSMRFEGRKRFFGGSKGEAVQALDGIDFSLGRGETLGIVGESGSGKTTLGRCIMRILDPTSGRMLFRSRDGRAVDLAALPEAGIKPFWREMRMIFQDPFSSLNPRMTVLQIVGEPLRNHAVLPAAEIEERVADLLRRVGLSPDAMRRYPHAFSGGQRQRIGIARAIALRPQLIVADEPTSALDVSLRAQVLDLLLDLGQELGLSYIFISHDISVIRYMCDRVAVMHRGRIVEIGATECVCEDPQHPYTQALISAIPKPDPRLRGRIQRRRYEPEAAV